MKLDSVKIERLERFLTKIASETYPEIPTEHHTGITRRMFSHFRSRYPLPPESRVLDVGCGQGVALALFAECGYQATGITLNEQDAGICLEKGYRVFLMDQSFLEFEDASFHLVWCRHCLEHSIFPYFTLSEFYRVVKPGGYLYVEVPSPDTSCRHQMNANHYSLLSKSMWGELIKRSGFLFLGAADISFEVIAGPDVYWAFFGRKEGEPA